MTATYKPKTLFSGAVIGKDIERRFVAVPESYDGKKIVVDYGGDIMVIDDWRSAEGYRVFEDKFTRNKTYKLGYFEFVPRKD